MKFTIAVIAGLFAAASAQLLSVTAPLDGAVYTIGSPANITWTKPTTDTISQIELATGDPSNLQHLDIIASNVPARTGFYIWNIPSNITAGQYAFIFGTSPNVAYSGRFTIQNSAP
ncbi:hypothetical protein BX666DRAFT_1874632 [Dichotomocladium elegans]|nr:hypothetical protein BX666DRAFT_1874632 [Dichotomocladium elegans]